MKKFALLLNQRPNRYSGMAEDDYMAIIKDYIAWVEKLSKEGVYQGGHKLMTQDGGKQLTAKGGTVEVHDGPFTEVQEILGGLMIIAAKDYDAAVEIAKTCPHMVHNSTLYIRELDEQV